MECADHARENSLVARLRAAGCVFAEDEAAALTAAARDGRELDHMVARRVAGEPLEVIVGFAEFAGLRIPVVPGVFVPRRRTELVVTVACRLAARGSLDAPSVVVDLCCGSGAIAAAVAATRPDLTVIAADIDPIAASLAARTLANFGAIAVVSDMDAGLPPGLRGTVGMVASCPPYVPSKEVALMPAEARDHEPRSALDGGEDGTSLQADVFAAASRLLHPGGHCVVETSEHLADATLAVARAAGFSASLETDDAIDAFVVIARR